MLFNTVQLLVFHIKLSTGTGLFWVRGTFSVSCSCSPQIIAAQEEMLRKERELEEARKKLAQIRQQQYKFLPSELREDEGWLAEQTGCAPCWWDPLVMGRCCRCTLAALLSYNQGIYSTWNRLGEKQVPVLCSVFVRVYVCVWCVYVFVSEWHWHSEFNMEKVATISKLRQYGKVVW